MFFDNCFYLQSVTAVLNARNATCKRGTSRAISNSSVTNRQGSPALLAISEPNRRSI